MSIHELAAKIAGHLAMELEFDHIHQARMAFGLELFLGEIVKLICLVTISYILGILPEVLVITATAGILRLASGGEHCSEYYRCLIGGTLCFMLLGWGVHYFTPMLGQQELFFVVLLSFLIAEIALWKYAPGDTENKPITEEKDKIKYKKWSLIIGVVYLVLMLVFSTVSTLNIITLAMAAGMTEQVFTVTPWGYRFLHFIDHIMDFKKVGGNGQ